MKAKLLFALGSVFLAFFSTGCHFQNRYYDDAKALADKVSTLHDQQAWKELLREANSSDFWTRDYALAFLAQLVQDNEDLDRKSVTDQFVVSLDDPRAENQDLALTGLIAGGPDGVAKGFDKIKPFVLSRDDNSVSWDAAKALGLLTAPPQANAAAPVLAQALLHKTPNENVHDAPRLRDMALESLANIGEKNPALVRTELEKILPELDAEYAKKTTALIDQLKAK